MLGFNFNAIHNKHNRKTPKMATRMLRMLTSTSLYLPRMVAYLTSATTRLRKFLANDDVKLNSKRPCAKLVAEIKVNMSTQAVKQKKKMFGFLGLA